MDQPDCSQPIRSESPRFRSKSQQFRALTLTLQRVAVLGVLTVMPNDDKDISQAQTMVFVLNDHLWTFDRFIAILCTQQETPRVLLALMPETQLIGQTLKHVDTKSLKHGLSRREFAAAGLACSVFGADAATAEAADTSWKNYPYTMIPETPELTLPFGDGNLSYNQSDSWYFQTFVNGTQSGRRFALMSIVNRNAVPVLLDALQLTRADIFQFAIFDLDNKTYATFSDFDIGLNLLLPPKLNAKAGHIDIEYTSSVGKSTWKNAVDSSGNLVPFVHNIDFTGKDQNGKAMRLFGKITFTRAPFPTGGDQLRGNIICFGQPNTLQYGEPGLVFDGVLNWGSITEVVHGDEGHYDRQTFPKYAGTASGYLGRDRSHQWLSPTFRDGTDLSIWLQYLRTDHNRIVPYQGVTAAAGGTGVTPVSYTPDVQQQVTSYVRFPFSSLPDLPIAPVSKAMYMPLRHRLWSTAMNFDIVAEPLIPAPAHVLPVPYMNGPVRWTGTYQGQPVEALGNHERTLGMYRNFELVQVLQESVTYLPPASFTGSQQQAALLQLISELKTYVDAGNSSAARNASSRLKSALQAGLVGAARTDMLQVQTDLAATL